MTQNYTYVCEIEQDQQGPELGKMDLSMKGFGDDFFFVGLYLCLWGTLCVCEKIDIVLSSPMICSRVQFNEYVHQLQGCVCDLDDLVCVYVIVIPNIYMCAFVSMRSHKHILSIDMYMCVCKYAFVYIHDCA